MDPEIDKILKNHESRITELERLLKTRPDIAQKSVSPREFILSKNFSDDVNKILIIGYYLEKFEGLTSFNAKDLEGSLRASKEAVPENINVKVIKNINKGFITEAKEKKEKLKAWYLTNSGEKYVENELSK